MILYKVKIVFSGGDDPLSGEDARCSRSQEPGVGPNRTKKANTTGPNKENRKRNDDRQAVIGNTCIR